MALTLRSCSLEAARTVTFRCGTPKAWASAFRKYVRSGACVYVRLLTIAWRFVRVVVHPQMVKLPALDRHAVATCVRFSHDGTKLCVGGSNGSVLLYMRTVIGQTSVWDPISLRTVREDPKQQNHEDAMKHVGAVSAIGFSRSGEFLLTASEDRSMIVWESRPGRGCPLLHFSGHSKGLVGIDMVDEEDLHAMTASKDGCLKVWDLHDAHAVRKEEDRVVFAAEGPFVASAEVAEAVAKTPAADTSGNEGPFLGSSRQKAERQKALTAKKAEAEKVATQRLNKLFSVVESPTEPMAPKGKHNGRVTATVVSATLDFAVTASEDREVKVRCSQWRSLLAVRS